jgi:methyltransferase
MTRPAGAAGAETGVRGAQPPTSRTWPPAWYLALWAFSAGQRLRELRISRKREAGLTGERACPRGYPLMVAAHIGLFLLPPLEIRLRGARCRHRLPWVLLLGAAHWLRWSSVRALGPYWNVRATVPSEVTPVTSGPYRVIRHPNYVAVCLEFVALPLAGGAPLSAASLSCLNALVLACRIRAEERLLARSPAYRRAFEGRARFIPKVF